MVTAVVMVGAPDAESAPVRWVQEARQAAAQDLLAQLVRQDGVDEVLLLAPNAPTLAPSGVTPIITAPGPLHVGRVLAGVVEQFGPQRLLYFGGGAAPLLEDDAVAQLVAQVKAADRLVVTNNRFSSDWAGVVPAAALIPHQERLPRDNMLGWVLSTEAGLPFLATPSEAATRLDIDTPADLLTLSLLPQTKPNLRACLSSLPLDTSALEDALTVLRTPARRVLLAGRIGPDAWARLNGVSQCWLRVLAEERGMVASGRAARGEVYSMLADLIDRIGMAGFFAGMPDWADLALIDTRILWAHHGFELSASERFASDLGLVDDIAHPWVASFTRLAAQSPIPIVLGGHSLLAGDLLALCDLLA